jgi:hypothetical protein
LHTVPDPQERPLADPDSLPRVALALSPSRADLRSKMNAPNSLSKPARISGTVNESSITVQTKLS